MIAQNLAKSGSEALSSGQIRRLTSIGIGFDENSIIRLTTVGSLWDKDYRRTDLGALRVGIDPQNPPVDFWGLKLALGMASRSVLFTGPLGSEWLETST